MTRFVLGLLVCALLPSSQALAEGPGSFAAPRRATDTLTITATAGGGPSWFTSGGHDPVLVFGANVLYRPRRRFVLEASAAPMALELRSTGSNYVYISGFARAAYEGRLGFAGGGLGLIRWSGEKLEDAGPIVRMSTYTAFVDLGLGSLDGAYLRGCLGGRIRTDGIEQDPGFLFACGEAQLPLPLGTRARMLLRYRFDVGGGAPWLYGQTLEARVLFDHGGRLSRIGPVLRYTRLDTSELSTNAIEAGITLRIGTRRAAAGPRLE